jgi:hypothetical protein
MTLLLLTSIAGIWLLIALVVAGACMSAAHSDRQFGA